MAARPRPTGAAPGSEGKVRVMARRAAHKQPLCVQGDASECVQGETLPQGERRHHHAEHEQQREREKHAYREPDFDKVPEE